MELSIIIVNYNTSQLVKDCVSSIKQKVSKDLLYEIIVVDNASTSEDILQLKQIEDIKLVLSPENLGFGKGNNLGVKQAKGKFLLFLNSDTLLIEDSFSIMLDFFRKNEKKLNIGALGCTLVDINKEPNGSYYNFTDCRKIIKSYFEGVVNKFSKSTSPASHIEKSSKEHFFVDFIIGADLMMKKSVFEEIGGFDKDFFMYFEEADLQLKLKKKNLNRVIVNTTNIIHLEGGSSDKDGKLSNRRRIMIQEGKNLYLKKNDPKYYPIYIIFDFLYSILRMFNRNYTIKENKEFFIRNIKSY